MDDHLVALAARVAPLAADFQSLMAAGLKACGPLYPDSPDVSSQEELEKMLKGTKERLQVWRSSSARAGADAALAFIMSWHPEIELEKIETLLKGAPWTTDPALIAKRQAAANYMAQYANTAVLDLEAEVYQDEEAASGSEVAESQDSGNYQNSDDDDDDEDDNDGSDGGDRRIPAGVRFTKSGKAYSADSSSYVASDFGLLELDEQATSDAAKTGGKADPAKASEAASNVELGEASNPAGSESAPRVETQAAAPEAGTTVTPPSPRAAEPPSTEAQPEDPQAESAAAPNTETNNAAAT